MNATSARVTAEGRVVKVFDVCLCSFILSLLNFLSPFLFSFLSPFLFSFFSPFLFNLIFFSFILLFPFFFFFSFLWVCVFGGNGDFHVCLTVCNAWTKRIRVAPSHLRR